MTLSRVTQKDGSRFAPPGRAWHARGGRGRGSVAAHRQHVELLEKLQERKHPLAVVEQEVEVRRCPEPHDAVARVTQTLALSGVRLSTFRPVSQHRRSIFAGVTLQMLVNDGDDFLKLVRSYRHTSSVSRAPVETMAPGRSGPWGNLRANPRNRRRRPARAGVSCPRELRADCAPNAGNRAVARFLRWAILGSNQ